jgi:hypothetical protein
MKKIFFILCLFIYENSHSQILLSKDQLVVNKWVHAVINIQCQTPKESPSISHILDEFFNHQINHDQFMRKLDSVNALALSLATAGTATYLLYKSHHYLLTAKHVLNDATRGKNAIFYIIILVNDVNNPGETRIIDNNNNMITEKEPFLIGNESYIFSSDDDDIAIVCLDVDPQGIQFWKTLDKRGYIPIKSDDIDTKCKIKPNQKIICIGYPQDISVVDVKNLPIGAFVWQSFQITTPILTHGVISDIIQDKNYFFGDTFVYHGNSGGPVVSNNKLVGIVHGFKVDTLKAETFHYRLYHSQFMKSDLIFPLLEKIDFFLFSRK